jgi:DNA-binding NtrC family response regulator
MIERLRADLAFCPADRNRYLAILDAVLREKPGFPVVVVSRIPEVSDWLDAIEAGASDYCAAPFESGDIQWLLEANLKRNLPGPRYRTAAH